MTRLGLALRRPSSQIDIKQIIAIITLLLFSFLLLLLRIINTGEVGSSLNGIKFGIWMGCMGCMGCTGWMVSDRDRVPSTQTWREDMLCSTGHTVYHAYIA